MRALIFIHRWLGVAFCLLFAMWFATGIVMHFVPFPDLSEAERVAGLAPIGAGALSLDAQAAAHAAGIEDPVRVRLTGRPDGPVYIARNATRTSAIHAADLTPAAVGAPTLALKIALAHAHARGLVADHPGVAALETYDQWTVPNGLDAYRPLYRIALGDGEGTELYVSSVTGEVVRDTTRRERAWNYVGSVTHWIYPTALRRHWRAWDATVWALSLAALLAALAGAVAGVLRLDTRGGRLASPYRGWHAWHHWMGLGCAVFVLTWITSGWLSMDHGRLFSTGKLEPAQASALRGSLAFGPAAGGELPPGVREVEWFAFGGRSYRRERLDAGSQRLLSAGDSAAHARPFLLPAEVGAAAQRLSNRCGTAQVVQPGDAYPLRSRMPSAPVYRVKCGELWIHVDGADGELLEALDPSRRAYRWFYSALHTLDFPALAAHPVLRTAAIVLLCALGFAFSLTAIVIGWRRVTSSPGRGARQRGRR